MTRRRWWVLATISGLAVGMVAALVIDTGGSPGATSPPSTAGSEPSPTTPIVESAPTSTPTTTASTSTTPPTASAVDERTAGPELLIWTTGGLPGSLAPTLRGLPAVSASTIVEGDDVQLTGSWSPDGWRRRPTRPRVVPPDRRLRRRPGDLRVGGHGRVGDRRRARPHRARRCWARRRPTSAGPQVGSTLEIDGRARVTVTAIVPDADVAAAELVVSDATGTQIGIATPRAALVRYTGDRADLERAVTASMPRGTVGRFRSPAETTYLRHGDAVLPQSLVKQRFGEFAVRPVDGTAARDRPGVGAGQHRRHRPPRARPDAVQPPDRPHGGGRAAGAGRRRPHRPRRPGPVRRVLQPSAHQPGSGEGRSTLSSEVGVMNRKTMALLLAGALFGVTGPANAADIKEDFKPSTLNQPGQQYPQVNSQGYARFRIVAPQAKSVTVSLGLGGAAARRSPKARTAPGPARRPVRWTKASTTTTSRLTGARSTIPAP